MPPEGDPVSPEEIQILTDWIRQGAKWSKHWAFEPMSDPAPPRVNAAAWRANPIDAFIYDSLVRAGLEPNAPADKAALIRRAYYDLTGLPPRYDQVRAFVADSDPAAYEQLLEGLLQSPHYGERWGRHWLDLVRYAETNSYERDGPKPNAYKYRDYVIKSFNDDKPYDQFVREQLAGDELDEVTRETLTATGYYRLGIWDDEPADPLLARYDGLDDIVMTTSQVFLGLTFNCARCHDHKIDPIPQADYYSMFGDVPSGCDHPGAHVVTNRDNNQIDVSATGADRQLYQRRTRQRQKRELEQEIRAIEQAGIAKMDAPDQRATEGPKRDRNRVLKEKLRDHLSDEQWTLYRELKQQLETVLREGRELPPRELVMGLARCEPRPQATHVLMRGNPHAVGVAVSAEFPEIFGGGVPAFPEVADGARSAGRRRVLADWIASEENMLTARVIANRVWQFHFGRGIVRSPNNFGQLGTPPTHPELLDFLARQLIRNDWRLKPLHKLIMNSMAYRMSSQARDEGLAVDPNNDRFWRFNPRRMSAEETRDTVLAVNGSLNPQVYGPSFYPTLSREVLAGQSRPGAGWGKSSEQDQNRRSVYIHVKRSLLTPLLTAFDFPDPDLTCEERFATLQPGQALSLLNSDFIHQQAERLATTIGAGDAENERVVRDGIQAVLSRDATDEEIKSGSELIARLETHHQVPRERAVTLYCVTLMNWNEFLFID